MEKQAKIPSATLYERKVGIVGFFDILGYQNFLERNDIVKQGDAVELVLRAFEEMHSDVQLFLKTTLEMTEDQEIERLNATRRLVFSDSVLLTTAYNAKESESISRERWFLFILQAAILQLKLFDFGLPVRGAISFGAYMVSQRNPCFAGKPIVDAHKVSARLNLAAVVLEASATAELQRVIGDETEMFSTLLADHLIPMKGAETSRFKTVNFVLRDKAHKLPRLDRKDARTLVAEAFAKHNKDISPSEHEKLTNTEILVRHLISH